jgi:hypothetical protein
MTASIAATAMPREVAAARGAASQPRPAQADPAEARVFANLMQPGTEVSGTTSSAFAPGALQGAAKAMAEHLTSNVRSIDEMRSSMLKSIDPRDPIGTMVVMTDHAVEAHTMFAKLHIATGLASAATSLFGTLLKNQG